jgi:transcriptional regulator with XRE-family HTH domain
MSSELGAWLRQQREDRGWTRSELARQLIKIARTRGDTSVPSADNISHNIYRWERGAVTPAERYQLYYCGAFGIPFSQFGVPAQPGTQPGAQPGTQPGAPALSGAPPGMVDPSLGAAAVLAYRELPSAGPAAPAVGAAAIRREVLMAAHEGSEHAERAEQRGIGEATLEQFRADTASLSRQYLTGEPFPLFTEMRRVRNRVAEALERRQWPRDAAELYLLAGCLSALMAAAATNLGYPRAAEELARAGWAYATIIDHRPLMARLRLCAAYAVYWDGHPEQTADLARSGLEYLADGQNAAQLHLLAGLASARRGDQAAARQAIAAARDARDRDHHDELLEIGGEFGFSRATQAYYAGFVLAQTRAQATAAEAATELEYAIGLYAAGPGPGEQHSRRCQMLAHTDLAITRLRAGGLDAAAAALEPVLALPPGERTAVQSQRLSVIRAELDHPVYRGSAQARGLDEQVAAFAPADLGHLPGEEGEAVSR